MRHLGRVYALLNERVAREQRQYVVGIVRVLIVVSHLTMMVGGVMIMRSLLIVVITPPPPEDGLANCQAGGRTLCCM